MSTYDNYLISKYKSMINLNNILYTNNSTIFTYPLNINNNIYISNQSIINNNLIINKNLFILKNNIINNNISINSNLYISQNSLLKNNLIISNINNNNLNINSNINISGITILNNNTTILSVLTTNNNVYFKNLYTNYINPYNGVCNINGNIINIGTPLSNININGTTSFIASNELNIVNKLITLNINSSTLTGNDIGNNTGLEILGITSSGYINSSNNGNYYQLIYPNNSSIYRIPILDNNNNLYITGNTLLYNDSTIKSSLQVNTNLLLGTITISSSIYISNNSILNKTNNILSNLYISKTSLLNSNNTIISNLFSNNIQSSNLSLLTLNAQNNIFNNTTILSTLYLSGNTCINNNVTLLNSLCLNNSILNKITLNSSLVNNNLYSNNLTVLSHLFCNLTTNINSNSLISNNLSISSYTNINSNLTTNSLVYINSTIVANNLPEYYSNASAATAGIPLWGFYRTGGIVKIRLSTNPPVINILESNPLILNKFDTYIEYGANSIDNMGNNIVVTITGSVNTNITGTYNIFYTATDSSYNTTTVIRIVKIMVFTYNSYEFSFSKMQINDPSQLTTGTNFIYNLFGLTSWTVEAWVNPTSYAGTAVGPIISLGDDQLSFDIDGGYVKFVLNYSTTLFTSTSTVPINIWSHIVWQRTNNNTFTIFINGITNFTGTILPQHISILNSLPNFPTKCVSLGRLYQFGANGYCFNGKIYAPKISNTALYLSNFTPNIKLPLLSSTIFFLGGNYTELIVGSTAVTVIGTVTSNTVMFTYNLSSTNACIGPIIKPNYFTSLQSNTNWTIEFYLNYTSTGGVTTLFVLGDNSIGTTTTNTSLILVLTDPAVRNVSGQPYMTTYMYNNNSFSFGNDRPLYINTWYHCVFTRYNNNSYIIINGVWSNPISSFSSIDSTTWNQIHIGAPSNIFSVSKTYKIAQFKITNTAVYTNPGVTFTPPAILEPTTSNNILFYFGDEKVDIINPSLSVPITGTITQGLR